MTKRDIAVAIFVAGAYLSAAAPRASGQIATQTDGAGKVIYMNDDSQSAIRKSVPAAPANPDASAPSPSGAASSPAATAAQDRLDRIVREAAERHKLDPALVKAVVNTESGWNPRAISNKGAVGLMQLIPGTAHRFGVRNLLDPAQNVEGGASYLKSLLDRYNGDLTKSLAAYNAGEGAVDGSGGVPAYAETQRYVQKVTDAYFQRGSGRIETLWTPPRPVVRREVDEKGHTVFTNE